MKRTLAIILLVSGCNASDMPPPPPATDITAAEGDFTYYVVNSLTVPMKKKDFSIDLNGDKVEDNQLGNLIGTLVAADSSGKLNPQTAVDKAVADGNVVILASVQAKSLKDATNVGTTLYLGEKMATPDFTGNGSFTVDKKQSPATFYGSVAGGTMSSNSPVTTTHPVTVTLNLPLLGSEPIALKLNGAHLKFTAGTASGKPTLVSASLQGSIRNTDVQTTVLPKVASLMTARVAGCAAAGVDMGGGGGTDGGTGTGPECDATAMTMEMTFDIGGCGTAKANDYVIETCEVANNSLIQGVLQPDIQVFDANGNYAPNPAKNATKDSLSVGIGFTAVAAKFTP